MGVPKNLRGIVYFGAMHKANARGLEWLSRMCHIPVFHVKDLEDALTYPGFWIIMACDKLVPNNVPGKLILSGPHMYVHDFPCHTQHVVYNCLCSWTQDLVKQIHPEVQTIVAPFPIPYDTFAPCWKTPKTKILLYCKYRPDDVVIPCYQEIQRVFPDTPIEVVIYLKYNFATWLKHLQEAMLVVFLIATESQGFAVQEAMCFDVPILLFDVKTVNETFFSRDKKQRWFDHPLYKTPIHGTAKNIWNEQCGEHITDMNCFKATLQKMKANLSKYHPRQIILEELSPEKCLTRFLTVPGWTCPTVPVPVPKECLFTECVVICSCVHTADTPLWNAPKRSVFSHAIRFQQLLQSIESVVLYLPHAHVLVAEASELTDQEQLKLKNQFPQVQVKMFHNHPDVQKQRDSLYKGATELYMLQILMSDIQKYDFFRKLSGRFEMTPQVQEWPSFPIAAQYYQKHKSPVCYGVPQALFPHFEYRLHLAIQVCKNAPMLIENVLFDQIPGTLETVGVQGLLFDGYPFSI